jgi:hypothetical protein
MRTWNQASLSALENIFGLVLRSKDETASRVRSTLDEFIRNLYDRPGGHERAMAWFGCIAADAIATASARDITFTVQEVHEILVRKQRDYGPENIRRFGRQGLMIRLHDKVARLENLDGGGRGPENESILDTFIDIIGYCAIGIMWERNEFLLPLE